MSCLWPITFFKPHLANLIGWDILPMSCFAAIRSESYQNCDLLILCSELVSELTLPFFLPFCFNFFLLGGFMEETYYLFLLWNTFFHKALFKWVLITGISIPYIWIQFISSQQSPLLRGCSFIWVMIGWFGSAVNFLLSSPDTRNNNSFSQAGALKTAFLESDKYK